MRKGQLYSIAFGFSLLVLLSFAMLLYNSINSFSEYSELVQKTQVIMNNLQKIHSKVIDAETGQRGFLLTKDSIFLDPLLSARLEIPAILDTLEKLTLEYPNQKLNLDTLKVVLWERLHIMEETLNRSPFYDGTTLTLRLKEGKILMDKFRLQLDRSQQEQQALLDEHARKQAEFQSITPSYFKTIISITALVSFISFILLMQEMKQRTAAQSLLETRFHALNQSNAELRQIAHVTSHDLQEPLRKIRIFSDALVIKFLGKLPEDVVSILKRINSNAYRMSELVADLSAFTSLSNPDGKIANVNLATILANVQTSMSTEIQQKKVTLTVSGLPSIMGYSYQLNMLFKELITNAIKFSKPGIDPIITIEGTNIAGTHKELLNSNLLYLVITVTDNGIGFEKEYANKIFILFQKLHSPEAYEGKGLGLSLCQRIMANHKGFITASSEIDQGSSFKLYFPV